VQAYLETLRPDVIHAHDVYGLMVKGLATPRVFTIHGFIYADTLVSGSRLARPRGWLWYWIETRGWADQPHIVSISPYVRERLHGIARGVIHDIENPIAPEFFHVERRRAPLPAEEPARARRGPGTAARRGYQRRAAPGRRHQRRGLRRVAASADSRSAA
jgi:hypothetical protein